MDKGCRCSTPTFEEISAWKLAASRWRLMVKRLMEPARFRFRGIVDGEVWERDLVVAPTQKWRRMIEDDPCLTPWSTAQFGFLTLALSPPVILLHVDLD